MAKSRQVVNKAPRRNTSLQTQRVPVTLHRYFVVTAGTLKGQTTYYEGRPSKDWTFSQGKTAADEERHVVEAPTTLRGLLQLAAKTIKQSARTTRFRLHRRGDAVCIYAFARRVRAGSPAVAVINDIQSPLAWWKDADGQWQNLPEGMHALREYYGIQDVLGEVLESQPKLLKMQWIWRRPVRSERDRKSMLVLRLTNDILRAKHLTVNDVRTLRLEVSRLNRDRLLAVTAGAR